MKTLPRIVVAALGSLFFAALAHAQVQFLLVEKLVDYTQVSESSPSVSALAPYIFRFQGDGNGGTSTSAYSPFSITGTPVTSGALNVVLNNGLHYSVADNNWEFRHTFSDKTSLDSQYLNGVYTLDINGTTGTIALGNGGGYTDLYPEVPPMVTGLSASDFNGAGQLVINLSLTSYTFNFNSSSFASYATGGHMRAFLDQVSDPAFYNASTNPNSSVQAEAYYFGTNTDPAFSALTFNPSASNMVAGNTYTLEIEYSLITDGMVDRFNDAEISAGLFTYRTSLTIHAVPEPSTYALLGGLAALLGTMLTRRCRQG